MATEKKNKMKWNGDVRRKSGERRTLLTCVTRTNANLLAYVHRTACVIGNIV